VLVTISDDSNPGAGYPKSDHGYVAIGDQGRGKAWGLKRELARLAASFQIAGNLGAGKDFSNGFPTGQGVPPITGIADDDQSSVTFIIPGTE
jgi:hypothetical protein